MMLDDPRLNGLLMAFQTLVLALANLLRDLNKGRIPAVYQPVGW